MTDSGGMRRAGGRPSRQALGENSSTLAQELQHSKKINPSIPDAGDTPDTSLESKAEGGTQPKTESGTQLKTEGRTEGKTATELKAETEGGTQLKTEGRTEGKTISELKAETESGTQLKTEGRTEGKTINELKAETEGETQLKTEGRTEGKTISELKAETEGETQPKTKRETQPKTKRETQKIEGASNNPYTIDGYGSNNTHIADFFFSFEAEKKSNRFRLLEALSKATQTSEIVGLTERLHHGKLCAKLKITDTNLKKLLVRLSDEGLISIDRERSKLGRTGWVRYWVRKEVVEFYCKDSNRSRTSADDEHQRISDL